MDDRLVISRWFADAFNDGSWPFVVGIVFFGLLTAFVGARRLSPRAQWVWWPVQGCAVVAVVTLLFPPSTSVVRQEGLLVTAGWQGEDAPSDNAWVMPTALVGDQAPPRNHSMQLRQVGRSLPNDLEVVGYGLTAFEWFERQGQSTVSVDLQTPSTSVSAIEVAPQTIAGRESLLRVKVAGWSNDLSLELLRQGGDEPLARSAVVTESNDVVIPSLTVGRHEFAIRLMRGDAEVQRALFGVQATAAPTLNVLVVQNTSSFEWRFLVNWLEELGASVALRSKISTQRYLTRFLNRSEVNLDSVSETLLDQQDLVILDGAALAALSDEERRRVLTLRARSHGVLVLIQDPDDIKGLQYLPGVADAGQATPLIYQIPESAADLASGLTRMNVQFDETHWHAKKRDLSDRPIVGQRHDQRLAVSIISDSFRLHGASGAARYAALWSKMLDGLAKPLEGPAIQVFPEHAAVFERHRVCLAGAAQPTLNVVMRAPDESQTELMLEPFALRPGESCAWVWPQQTGWYRFSAGAHFVERYFVASSQVASRRASEAYDMTARMGTGAGAGRSVSSFYRPVAREVILPWTLFALFLAWLAQRWLLAPQSS
ncbi:MAG: hypothetical protein AAFN07_01100 [Pseudomonadota bacterium]